MKKIFVVFLILCFVLSGQAFALTDNNTNEKKSLSIFSNLSVKFPEKNMQDNVTRGEFVSMIIHAFEGNNIPPANTEFSDVDSNYEYSGEIKKALDKGVVSHGNEFKPQDNITYIDAYTMLVRIIGRESFAKQAGGYPNGYLIMAVDCGLNKNVVGKNDDALVFSDALIMLLNMAECDLFYVDKINPNGIDYTLGESLLEEQYHIFEIRGVETANSITTLYEDDKNVEVGKIRINDDIYYYDGPDYLGYGLHGYAREFDGENYIVYLEVEGNVKSNISLKNISYDGSKIVEETDSKEKKYSIESNCAILYNSKAANKMTVADVCKLQDGYITLIDNNDDGKYDVIDVNEFSVVKVKSVNTYDRKIIDENGNDFIDLSDDEVKFSIFSGKKEIPFSKIRKGDVLSVYKSLDKKSVKIIVNGETKKGILTSIYSDEQKIGIDDGIYEYSKNIEKKVIQNCVLGQKYEITLDQDGIIIDMQIQTNDSIHYGYYVNQNKSNGIADEYIALIYTDEGSLNEYKYARKVKFNDVTKNPDEIFEEFKKNNVTEHQLVRFRVNQNQEIIMIDTSNAEGRIDSNVNPNNQLSKFKFPLKVANSLWYITANNSFHPYFYLSDETKIFLVSNGDNVSNEKRCVIKSEDYFENNRSQKVSELNVYDVSEDGVAGAIVICSDTANEPTIGSQASIGIVYSITDAIDYDEDITYKLIIYVNGEYKTYYVNSNYLDKYATDDKLFYLADNDAEKTAVGEGDCVLFGLDNYGEISAIQCIYDMSAQKLIKGLNDNETSTHIGKGVVYSGRVYSYSGSMVTIIPDGVPGINADAYDETSRFSFRISGLVNVVGGRNINIYESDVSEILPYKQVNDKCSKIIIRCNDGVPVFAAIYE